MCVWIITACVLINFKHNLTSCLITWAAATAAAGVAFKFSLPLLFSRSLLVTSAEYLVVYDRLLLQNTSSLL